jgi:hypothetical protein
MTALRLLLVCLFVGISAFAFSQEETYMFNHYKSQGEKNIVYFNIDNLDDDKEEQDRVLEVLLNDELVIDGNIYTVDQKKSSCQLEVDFKVSVAYVRNLLQSAGYDIDLTSVTPKNPGKPDGVYSSERYSFFEGFDAFKNYDINKPGALSPEDHYAKEKDAWVAQNPEEYDKAKKQNGTAIVVRRKDFESFTPEKQQHMLSHPEMFIIEE